MASFFVLLLLSFLSTTVTTSSVDAARQFTVGDHFGWREPDSNNTAFYTQWAERNRFQIGDSLVFEYENDSVLTVEKLDYFSCETSSPITEFTNGKSTLDLDRSGPFYFISGTDDHCNHGQKLLVEVMAPHDHPIPISDAPAPSTSLPPQQPFSPSWPPSPSYHTGDTIQVASSSNSIAPITSTFMPQFLTFLILMMLMLAL